MKYIGKTVILILLLFAPTANAVAGPEEEIAEVAKAQSVAFTQGNVDWYLAAFADDAVLSPPGGVARAVGTKAIRSGLAQFFQNFPMRESVPSEAMIRIYNNGTVAIRNELRDETLVDRDGKTTIQKTLFSQVLLKAGDRWMIVEQHNSRVPAPPGPPGAN